MSTRATVHFQDENKVTQAIIYRHSDGYPEGVGKDLSAFLGAVGKLKDTRFDDPSYLAAKWVVYDAARNAAMRARYEPPPRGAESLAFLGVGIVLEDPLDIEYRYRVICADNGHRPTILTEKVEG